MLYALIIHTLIYKSRNIRKEKTLRKESLKFLEEFVNTPSPSGFEYPAQRVWKKYVSQFTKDIRSDAYGNTIGVLNPEGRPRVMLSGHCDEVGFMVTYINDDGYIYFAPIGGVDVKIVPAKRVCIHNERGMVKGTVGRLAIHMLYPDDMKKHIKYQDLWIDIGAKDREDAEKYVSVGDPLTFDIYFEHLRNDLVMARGFDNKMGSFVVAETIRLLHDIKMTAAVFGVSSIQEEIGAYGAHISAFGIEPDVGLVTDVTHATDTPDVKKERFGFVKMGNGPVIGKGSSINPVVEKRLRETAEKNNIPYQRTADPRGTGTDADRIAYSRKGVPTGLASVPNRYMHTPGEILHLEDLENTAKLFAEFIKSLDQNDSFVVDI